MHFEVYVPISHWKLK